MAIYLNIAASFLFSKVCSILEQSLEYLESLKIKRIAHRDFKLENQLFNYKTGHVSNCDYGFSIDLTSENFLLSSQKPTPLDPLEDIFQTISIRAPEVFLGYQQYNESIDVYGLALSIYTLYTGLRLFPIYEKVSHIDRINYHLNLMIQQFGMPPAHFLKSMKRAHHYFQFDPIKKATAYTVPYLFPLVHLGRK